MSSPNQPRTYTLGNLVMSFLTGGVIILVGALWATSGSWWVSKTFADNQAKAAAESAAVSALVPYCLESARTDPEGAAVFAGIKQITSGYRADRDRSALVRNAGWVGESPYDDEVISACAASLYELNEFPGSTSAAQPISG